jgi:hypothetical protein
MMHHTKIVTRRRIVRYRIVGSDKTNLNSKAYDAAIAGIVFASIGAWQPKLGNNQRSGCPSLLQVFVPQERLQKSSVCSGA